MRATDDLAALRADRSRQAHDQRARRIFDPKTRTIGIDKEGLDRQIEEKQRRREEERKVQAAYDMERVRQAKLGEMMEREENEMRRRTLKDIEEYRHQYQSAEVRRGVGLEVREEKEGPSSLRTLLGEDVSADDRRKAQQEQLKEWVGWQLADKEDRKKRDREIEKQEEREMLARDEQAAHMRRMEEDMRRAINTATTNYNRALAEEQKSKRDNDKRRDIEDNTIEIENHIYSDWLTENPAQATSVFGPHRKIGYKWKGMSKEEKDKIEEERRRQLEEMKQKRDQEAKLQVEHERAEQEQTRRGLLMEREEMRKRREIQQQQSEMNKIMGVEQKERNTYADRNIHRTNLADEAFFQQFNRFSTR